MPAQTAAGVKSFCPTSMNLEGTRRGSRIRTKNTKYDTPEYETDPEGSMPDESLPQRYEPLPTPLAAEVSPPIAVKEEAKFAIKNEVKPVIKDEAKIDVKDEAKFAIEDEAMVVSNGEESESEDDVAPTTDQNGDPLSERITTNTAMREYGLHRRELDRLKCELRDNPHYRSAAPMRLYNREEVRLLGKQMKKKREEDRKQEAALAVERAAQKKVEAKEAADAAKRTVAGFKPFATAPVESGLSIAWQIILPRLPDHFCHHWKKLDVLGSQRVMADLSNLALTCKEMSQQISVHALPVLADKVHRTAWERSGVETGSNDKPPAIWDKILCAPKACTLPELKEAAKQVKLARTGTKDEIILRIYSFFNMTKPCPKEIPAAIAFAMRFPPFMGYNTSSPAALHAQACHLPPSERRPPMKHYQTKGSIRMENHRKLLRSRRR